MDFAINKSILSVDRELLGEAVYKEITSELSGSFEEIGSDIIDVLYECQSEREYELVNSAIRAITGSSLERLVEITKGNEEKEL